jgi:hypothetical protein
MTNEHPTKNGCASLARSSKVAFLLDPYDKVNSILERKIGDILVNANAGGDVS